MLTVPEREHAGPAADAPQRSRGVIRVAEGLVANEAITQIAREEGLSRQWVTHEANSPAIQNILAELVTANIDKLKLLFGGMLDAIEASFGAQ